MVSVVIPVFNLDLCGERSQSFLFLVNRLVVADLGEIVIIAQDKGSECTLAVLWASSPSSTYVVHIEGEDDTKVELSRMRNVGVLASSYEYVLLLDSDVYVNLTAVKERAEKKDFDFVKPFSAICKLTQAETASFFLLGSVPLSKNNVWANSFGGGAVLCRKRAYLKMRGYDESFVGWSPEDTDFFYRVKKRFLIDTSMRCPAVHLWHPNAPGASCVLSSELEQRLSFHEKCSRDEAISSVESCISQDLSDSLFC